MIFTGDFHFFDYKYNIPGYSGQDYGGAAQTIYLAVSLALIVLLFLALRKTPREKVLRIIGVLGIFLTVYYLAKTAWETTYDIRQSGGFNIYLLPLDTCSIIMSAAILAAFGKGRLRRIAAAWIMTGGILGGLGAMLFLTAFKYYPFLSFGAFYSMSWHFLMVLMGLLLIAAEPAPLPFSIVTDGFLFHCLFSAAVIAVDYIFGLDFMFYREMSSLPFFDGVAAQLNQSGLFFLTPLIMLALYFAGFVLVYGVAAACKRLFRRG